jgi:energy-coupling factor transporter ATP-binding protein EcfA2
LTLICGPVGTGKSTLVRHLAHHAATTGHQRVLFCDAEGNPPRRYSSLIHEIGVEGPVDVVPGAYAVPFDYQQPDNLPGLFNVLRSAVHNYDLIIADAVNVLDLPPPPPGQARQLAARSRFLGSAIQWLRLGHCALVMVFLNPRSGPLDRGVNSRLVTHNARLVLDLSGSTEGVYSARIAKATWPVQDEEFGFRYEGRLTGSPAVKGPGQVTAVPDPTIPTRFNREDPI